MQRAALLVRGGTRRAGGGSAAAPAAAAGTHAHQSPGADAPQRRLAAARPHLRVAHEQQQQRAGAPQQQPQPQTLQQIHEQTQELLRQARRQQEQQRQQQQHAQQQAQQQAQQHAQQHVPPWPQQPDASAAADSQLLSMAGQSALASAKELSLWLGACDMLARSPSLTDWRRAAHQLQVHVLPLVCTPLGVQQAWAVICTLAERPLPLPTARMLGGVLVGLLELTLQLHDTQLLQRLLAARGRFSFSRRHVERAVAAAAAADVELEQLQQLLELLPGRASISSRSAFTLAQAFAARQQHTEAAHVLDACVEAGVRLSPAAAALRERLKGPRRPDAAA